MARISLACQFALIVGIVFAGAVSARHSKNQFIIPHMCDNSEESSEECNNLELSSNGPLRAKTEFEVKFTLYNPRGEDFTFTRDTFEKSRAESGYSQGDPWKILVHGFLNNRDTLFPQNVLKALQKYQKYNKGQRYNILVFDWGKGACAHVGMGSAYLEAVKNVRRAAEKLADMIQYLNSRHMLESSQVHMIGHSLGAHVVGTASLIVKDLGMREVYRISALDPAGPAFWKSIISIPFWNNDAVDYRKLNSTEATFVDVYHTSGTYGTIEQLGDVDIYVNGGLDQPSCDIDVKIPILGSFKLWVFRSILQVCSHNYATDLYAKSINDDNMRACFGCESYLEFKSGKCNCDNLILGEHLVENPQSLQPKGVAYAKVAKDTSVGSNYLQVWDNLTWKDLITGTWNALCPIW